MQARASGLCRVGQDWLLGPCTRAQGRGGGRLVRLPPLPKNNASVTQYDRAAKAEREAHVCPRFPPGCLVHLPRLLGQEPASESSEVSWRGQTQSRRTNGRGKSSGLGWLLPWWECSPCFTPAAVGDRPAPAAHRTPLRKGGRAWGLIRPPDAVGKPAGVTRPGYRSGILPQAIPGSGPRPARSPTSGRPPDCPPAPSPLFINTPVPSRTGTRGGGKIADSHHLGAG